MIETGFLLDQARQRTGLTDFGEESFLDPLEHLVSSINQECELTDVGKTGAPEMLINGLVNRLEIESWYQRHPEIDDEQIVAPVFGISMPRTGSTTLGFILSVDRNTRVLRDWEANRLCPPPESATEFTDPRIAATEAGNEALEAMVPELRNMLPRDAQGPTECYYLLSYAFATPALETFFNVPGFSAYVSSPDFDLGPAYRFHRRAIKLLQWRCPPKRWFLRSPPHLFGLDALLEVYPDARFVMSHRDPVKSVTSMCSFMHRFRSGFVSNLQPEILGPAQMRLWAKALQRTLDFRDRIGEERFYDVAHRRQTADPVEQIHGLYDFLGWEFGDELEPRIRQWQKNNPKGSHSADPAFFNLDADSIKAEFQFYIDRYQQWL